MLLDAYPTTFAVGTMSHKKRKREVLTFKEVLIYEMLKGCF